MPACGLAGPAGLASWLSAHIPGNTGLTGRLFTAGRRPERRKMTTTAPDIRPSRRLIAVLLLAAAALDLTRCCLVLMTARHPAPAAALVATGLAAAALCVRTARGYRAGRCWAGWTALLIGALSAPQAAASGFHAPYAIPDTAPPPLACWPWLSWPPPARPASRDTTSRATASSTESHPLTGRAAALT
jgi:hypothetical protein